MTIWHHCRACGEEGLTPDTDRCPNCGVTAPVTLCERCGRAIRDGDPWRLTLHSIDPADEPTRTASYHPDCYIDAKRTMLREFRPPNWRVEIDARDPHDPISKARLVVGIAMALGAVLLAVWLIANMPRPAPVLGLEEWEAYTRGNPAFRSGPPVDAGPLLFDVAAGLAGLFGFIVLIRWGLQRRRALFWSEIPDDGLPPK